MNNAISDKRGMTSAIIKALVVASGLATASAALAQAYPSKPIHVIVPYSAGGSTDAIARFVAQGLSKRFKTETVVENKPGGNTIIATQYVTAAKPDGYTLYVTNIAPYSMLPAMYKKMPSRMNSGAEISRKSMLFSQ